MIEKSMKHAVPIDITMYNAEGLLVPCAYQRMIMTMIEEHLDALNIGEKRLMRDLGISWILISDSIVFRRRISPTDKLFGITWHAGGRIPSFRRDFVFEDEGGDIIAGGTTVSALLDNEKRRVCLDKDKLSVISLSPEAPYLEEVAERRFEPYGERVLLESRRVRPSMIDGVGHVNNTKYCDFVYDAMTVDDLMRLGDIKRIDVWFNAELRLGDTFDIYRTEVNTACSAYSVFKSGMPRSSFDMKLTYFDR